jgi:hypothetical protein
MWANRGAFACRCLMLPVTCVLLALIGCIEGMCNFFAAAWVATEKYDR